MKISFDLDGTLIPDLSRPFDIEKRSFWQQWLGIEQMRQGTPAMINTLRQKGHQVGIYTTSYRRPWQIKLWLASYGTTADFIINEKRNNKALSTLSFRPSKYPPIFQIDLHIDDLQGLEIEGKRYNFKTIILPQQPIDLMDLVEQVEGMKSEFVNVPLQRP